MGSLSPERARQLLGADINGHDLVAGHANRNGLTLLTAAHRWQRRPRGERSPRRPADGSRLINTALVLLFVLADGLLVVSYAAQYAYTFAERHQNIAAAIEAGALDVGMIIFSLLALGLARKGQGAKVERALVVACAAGSALMNFAPANSASWRSVLVWIMPPIFLAVVVDRCVRTVQRHVLASTAHETDSRSPWTGLGLAAYRLARFTALTVLYSLRFVIDRRGTWAGVKQAVINATPLPQASPLVDITVAAPKAVSVVHAAVGTHRDRSGPTKTSQFLDLVKERHGELASIPLGDVSRIATDLAPEVSLHPSSARGALLRAVRGALPAGGSDSK